MTPNEPQNSTGSAYARVVAQAWTDDSFKRRLLSDPAATLRTEGIEVPDGIEIRVVENTDTVIHFVLPAMSGPLSDEQLEQISAGGGYSQDPSYQGMWAQNVGSLTGYFGAGR
jgi:Nitrile hydratase, alpha chain